MTCPTGIIQGANGVLKRGPPVPGAGLRGSARWIVRTSDHGTLVAYGYSAA